MLVGWYMGARENVITQKKVSCTLYFLPIIFLSARNNCQKMIHFKVFLSPAFLLQWSFLSLFHHSRMKR